MSKVHDRGDRGGERWIVFQCPGCGHAHSLPVIISNDPPTKPQRPWSWNGSLDKPTLLPSILVNKGSSNPTVPVCHSYIKEGAIQFLPDSTHALAGKTVELSEWVEPY